MSKYTLWDAFWLGPCLFLVLAHVAFFLFGWYAFVAAPKEQKKDTAREDLRQFMDSPWWVRSIFFAAWLGSLVGRLFQNKCPAPPFPKVAAGPAVLWICPNCGDNVFDFAYPGTVICVDSNLPPLVGDYSCCQTCQTWVEIVPPRKVV